MKSVALKLGRKLLLYAVSESLRRALPRIYKDLDAEMPNMMKHRVVSRAVEDRIAVIAHHTLKRNPTQDELFLIRLFYDPVVAASNHAIGVRANRYL